MKSKTSSIGAVLLCACSSPDSSVSGPGGTDFEGLVGPSPTITDLRIEEDGDISFFVEDFREFFRPPCVPGYELIDGTGRVIRNRLWHSGPFHIDGQYLDLTFPVDACEVVACRALASLFKNPVNEIVQVEDRLAPPEAFDGEPTYVEAWESVPSQGPYSIRMLYHLEEDCSDPIKKGPLLEVAPYEP